MQRIDMSPHAAADKVARDSYGRIIAFLARRGVDWSSAEDALSEAFLAAIQKWPHTGVPENPDAWLLTAARRKLIDASRKSHAQSAAARRSALSSEAEPSMDDIVDGLDRRPLPDERVALMFACAHPALAPDVRIALMLNAVLGIEAARIAPAFVLSPVAMAQRLVRAKAKIRDAGITLETRPLRDDPDRLADVLEAIYGAFGISWADPTTPLGTDDLSEQAIDLCRVLCTLAPREPEALGLLALMLHAHARRDARRTPAGEFVPLAEQDLTRWNRAMITEAEETLRRAAALASPGRFQLEAAIQSAHSARAFTGITDWPAINWLYASLVASFPTLGAIVAQAGALSASGNASAALEILDALSPDTTRSYQPYWATRAHALRRITPAREAEARAATDRAIELSTDDATRQFLARAV